MDVLFSPAVWTAIAIAVGGLVTLCRMGGRVATLDNWDEHFLNRAVQQRAAPADPYAKKRSFDGTTALGLYEEPVVGEAGDGAAAGGAEEEKAADSGDSRLNGPRSGNSHLRALRLVGKLKKASEEDGYGARVTRVEVELLRDALLAGGRRSFGSIVRLASLRRMRSAPGKYEPAVERWIDGTYTPRGTLQRRRSFKKLFERSAALAASAADVVAEEEHGGELAAVLSAIDDWSFNVWPLADSAAGPVVLVMRALFRRHELSSRFAISDDVLLAYFDAVQVGYRSSNPYHNATHGADVAQAMHYMLQAGTLGAELTAENVLAALTAAAVHDYAHPGLNNPFLVAVEDELAVRYNNRSPLENMHVAATLELMREPSRDLFAALSTEARASVRELMIEMVLATDNATHAAHLHELEHKLVADEPLALDTHDDLALLLGVALHAADVSNPARPWDVSKRWADAIREEFFAQSDKERELDLHIPHGGFRFLDRAAPVPQPKMQAGFLAAIVVPLFDTLARVSALRLDTIREQLGSNVRRWTELRDVAAT